MVIFDFLTKITPNDPKLAQKQSGVVFGPLSALFWLDDPASPVENAYSGHLEGPISRDLGGFRLFDQNHPKSPQVGPETVWSGFWPLFGPFRAQRPRQHR